MLPPATIIPFEFKSCICLLIQTDTRLPSTCCPSTPPGLLEICPAVFAQSWRKWKTAKGPVKKKKAAGQLSHTQSFRIQNSNPANRNSAGGHMNMLVVLATAVNLMPRQPKAPRAGGRGAGPGWNVAYYDRCRENKSRKWRFCIAAHYVQRVSPGEQQQMCEVML